MNSSKLFRYVRDNEENDGAIYKAEIQLPDDGTPGSEQCLVITVNTHTDNDCEVHLAVHSGRGVTAVCSTTNLVNLKGVAAMLYGAAKLVTRAHLVPT